MEIFRKVPGYPNYQISIDTKEGRCSCLNYNHTGKIKELSNKPHRRDNRIFWTLCNDGKITCQQAARWIALTYPELVQNDYFEGAEIDHIDTNRLNNHPSNLRWVTRGGNMNNPLTRRHLSNSRVGVKWTEAAKKKLKVPHKNRRKLVQYTKNGVIVKEYDCIMEMEKETGFLMSNIASCCRGKQKTAYGFIWRYAV